ncbi:acetyltransferase [Arthrobacter phage JEGGS]|uniref:Acetyltransferase n=2 Tax=Mudcatvirus TaxID=1982088 RepID=A0A222Z847_9CAUD|nr:acetyltransferase [Arthrobacter phage Heisenberger]YP_010666618.1 acetyltransferase [Arthrobacter phage JEGGS]ASR80293.1 acetyltransferase [Arthrobacter phage Heisenberger]QDM57522.1 acetyltransferase [Arthrobacter phage JEGGS]
MNGKTIIIKHESASLQLHDFGNGMASVSHVFAKERRKGHASALMEKLVEYADDHNLVLNLEVRRYGHPIGPDNEILKSFYSKYGFVQVRAIKDRTTINDRYFFMSRPVEG